MISKNAWVLLLGAAAGCAASTKPDTVPAPVQAPSAKDAPADENLVRLRGLAVFEVGGLVVDAPQGAYSCYGVCPEHKEAVAAAERKSADRLGRLVDVATAAAPDPSPATCERAAIDANLAALRDLRIVDIPALIEDKPEAKPNCYNQVCPGEAEAARVKNCERAAKLAGIAAAAKGI